MKIIDFMKKQKKKHKKPSPSKSSTTSDSPPPGESALSPSSSPPVTDAEDPSAPATEKVSDAQLNPPVKMDAQLTHVASDRNSPVNESSSERIVIVKLTDPTSHKDDLQTLQIEQSPSSLVRSSSTPNESSPVSLDGSSSIPLPDNAATTVSAVAADQLAVAEAKETTLSSPPDIQKEASTNHNSEREKLNPVNDEEPPAMAEPQADLRDPSDLNKDPKTTNVTPKDTWCDRAKGVRKLSKKGEPFTLPSGEACIKIPNSVIEKHRKSWDHFVLGQFYSDPPSQGTLHNIVNGIWSKHYRDIAVSKMEGFLLPV